MQDIKTRTRQVPRSWGIWIIGALALGIMLALLAGPGIRNVYAATWQGVRMFVSGGGGDESDFLTQPNVQVDSAGYVHLTWISGTEWLMYRRGQLVNNATDIIWDASTEVSLSSIAGNTRVRGSTEHSLTPQMIVDERGWVHIAFFGENSVITYLVNTQRGNPGGWSYAQVYNTGDVAATFAISMALDDANVPYIAWAQGLGGNSSRLRYSFLNGSSFSGPVIMSPGYFLVKTSSLAVSGSGNNARIHAAYWIGENGDGIGDHKAEYSEIARAGGSYSAIRLNGLVGHGSDTSLALDRNTGILFMNYIARASDGGFNFLFGRKLPGAASWDPNFLSDRLDPGNNNIWPGFSPMSVRGDTVHIATEYKFSGATQFEIYHRTYQISSQSMSPWTRISDQSVSFETKSVAPRISAYGGIVSTWITGFTQHVKGNVAPNSVEPIPTATPTTPPSPTPIPNPVIEQMTVLGTEGADKTTSIGVDVRLGVQNGTPPYRFQLSNDGVNYVPAEPAPLVDPIGWGLIDAGISNACSNRVVYARVYDSQNRVSNTAQDQIILDPGVDVNVAIQNPFLPSSQITNVADFAGGGNGASNGHPGYTRAFFYYGRVQVLSGECSGIAAALFGQMEPLNMTQEGVAETLPLTLPPGVTQETAQDGEYNIAVQVQDGVGNQDIYAETIVLDRSSPVMSNASSEPGSLINVSNGQGATITQTDSVLVDLTITDLELTDTTFGDREGVPVWGFWLANSDTNIDPSNQTELEKLNWLPVPVSAEQISESNGLYSLTIPGWSVVAGLTNPDLTAGSDYYIYARALDGAGNPSNEVIRTDAIEFSQDVTLPTLYAPSVFR